MTHHSSEDYLPAALQKLSENPRITVRRPGIPAKDGKCVVYWMQRAQRALDNPALDIAIEVANELNLPVIVYFSAISNFPSANLRHYSFLNQGLRDIEADLAERGIAFIVRRPPATPSKRFSPRSEPRWSSATKIPAANPNAGAGSSPIG